MSFDSLLINNCIVKWYPPGAFDPYGNPVKVWADKPGLADEHCRISYPSGKQIQRVQRLPLLTRYCL